MADLIYPPDWITIRTPLGKSRMRGFHSTSQLPMFITTRFSRRDVDLIDLEAAALNSTRSYFIRFVSTLSAQYLHKQRTGQVWAITEADT